MNASNRFRILPTSAEGAAVAFSFDGQALSSPPGRSVAAALLASGVGVFRQTSVSGAARAPYCMMGVCFDCLVEIDGVPNRQACLVEIRQGMAVRTQCGARRTAQPEASSDGH